MTTTLIEPPRAPRGPATPDPLTPLGHTSWGPIFLAAGGRTGGGVEMIVDDDDSDGDPWGARDIDEDDDDGDDADAEDDDEEDPRTRRGQRTRRGRRESPEDDEGGASDRERLGRMEKALERANRTAARNRYFGKVAARLGIDASDPNSVNDWFLDRGIDPANGNLITADTGNGNGHQQQDEHEEPQAPQRTREQVIAERRRYEERGAARAEERFKPAVALFAAEAALREAGWSGKNMGRVLKMIDIDNLDVHFDGEGWPAVVGLEEEIEGIRGEFPEWFRGEREDEDDLSPRRRPGRRTGVREIDGGERGRPADKPKGWKELLDERIRRGGR